MLFIPFVFFFNSFDHLPSFLMSGVVSILSDVFC